MKENRLSDAVVRRRDDAVMRRCGDVARKP